MKEMWKEFGLSSLRHGHSTAAGPSFTELTLQEFLACPFGKDSPPRGESGDTETPSSDALTSAFCACSKRKRGPACDVKSSEWKKIKLMKNRESAARSRARKQAYTYESELDAAHLVEENAKLRKQVEKLRAAVLGDANQKKQKLRRTLTAPF